MTIMESTITPEIIKTIVENNTEEKDLTINNRSRNLATIRGMYMHLCRKHTVFSLAYIADLVNRKHCTVIHWDRNLEDLIRFDKRYKELFYNLELDLNYLFDTQALEVLNRMKLN